MGQCISGGRGLSEESLVGLIQHPWHRIDPTELQGERFVVMAYEKGVNSVFSVD